MWGARSRFHTTTLFVCGTVDQVIWTISNSRIRTVIRPSVIEWSSLTMSKMRFHDGVA